MAFKQSITNMVQLESVLNEYVRKGLELASERIIDKLLEFIEHDVYSRRESEWYKRTGDLLKRENWIAEIHKGMKGYTLIVKFSDNPVFSYGDGTGNNLQHTNSMGDIIDPEQLIGILNNPNAMSPDINLSYWTNNYPEPFWYNFEQWCYAHLDEVVQQALNGLK